jgi:hypothetical protein
MPVSNALRAVDYLAGSPAFEATFDHTRAPFSGRGIAVPVTVAFGDRDWILPRGSRRRDELPAHTKWIETSQLIPEGTGDLRVLLAGPAPRPRDPPASARSP